MARISLSGTRPPQTRQTKGKINQTEKITSRAFTEHETQNYNTVIISTVTPSTQAVHTIYTLKGYGTTNPARPKLDTSLNHLDLRHFYQVYEGSRKHLALNLLIYELFMELRLILLSVQFKGTAHIGKKLDCTR
jgi:hypothetical protein